MRLGAERIAWPADLPAQVAAVAAVLAQSATALALDDIAARFTGRGAWKKRLPQIVDNTLAALGRAPGVGRQVSRRAGVKPGASTDAARIRREARADAYRAAFDRRAFCTFGFLLGSVAEQGAPFFEFVLVSSRPAAIEQVWRPSDFLRPQRAAAEQVARYSQTKVIGLFAAYDDGETDFPELLLETWIEATHDAGLEYFILFPTDMGETFWATLMWTVSEPCSMSSRLVCGSVVGRRSDQPHDNPRRVRKLWQQLLKADGSLPQI